VIRAGLRRLATVAVVAVAVVAALSAVGGLAFGTGLARAVSLGFYVVGAFLLVGGLFFGNRGPVRLRSLPGEEGVFGVGGKRRLRWATREEQEDALATSALYVLLGVILVVVGVVVDDRLALF
jgi:hypothetical protein